MVGKWLIKMFKTQFNVFSMFQVYVSSCIFLPVSLLLPWWLLSVFMTRENWWLIVHPLWLLQWKVAVLLWWCHFSDWSDRAFRWHAHIGLYQYHGHRAVRIIFRFCLFVLRQMWNQKKYGKRIKNNLWQQSIWTHACLCIKMDLTRLSYVLLGWFFRIKT